MSASNKSSLGGFEIFSNVSRLTGKLNKLNISSSRMPGKSEVKRQDMNYQEGFLSKQIFLQVTVASI